MRKWTDSVEAELAQPGYKARRMVSPGLLGPDSRPAFRSLAFLAHLARTGSGLHLSQRGFSLCELCERQSGSGIFYTEARSSRRGISSSGFSGWGWRVRGRAASPRPPGSGTNRRGALSRRALPFERIRRFWRTWRENVRDCGVPCPAGMMRPIKKRNLHL